MVILMSLTIFNSIEKLKQDTTCLQYLSKEQMNFLYNTDININTDIVELIEQLTDFLQKQTLMYEIPGEWMKLKSF